MTVNKLFKDTVVIRDIQEFLVFLSLTYNWSTFYWAVLLQISVEVGELGWWITYKKKIYHKSSLYYDIFSSLVSKYRFFYDLNLNLFSKKHAYYLTLNALLKPITRYKPYIINSVYNNTLKMPYKNSLFFGKSIFFKQLLPKITTWLGFAFVFEILMLRFQQPISRFLFGEVGSDFHIPFFIRLKFFKDVFSEFTWLTTYTYFSTRYSLDHFLWSILFSVKNQIISKSFYFRKFRDNWFLSILKNKIQNYTTYLPEKRWSIITFFISCCYIIYKNFVYSILLILFLCFVGILTFITLLAFCYLILKIVFHFFINIFFILLRIK